MQPGSILTVTGTAVKSEHAELGVEVIHPTMTIEVPIQEAPPVEYYKPEIHADLEFILDHRPIALRNRQIQAVFKIQAEIAHAYQPLYARYGQGRRIFCSEYHWSLF